MDSPLLIPLFILSFTDCEKSEEGSAWAEGSLVAHFLRTGNQSQAREQAAKLKDELVYKMVDACLNHAPPADVDKDVRELALIVSDFHDPEAKYMNAEYFAACGQKDIAVRLMKSAIAGHYCPYTDLQTNAMLASCGARRSLPSCYPPPDNAAMTLLPRDRNPRAESS